MKFGKSAKEAENEQSRGGFSGDFIRYLKDGDTTLRILQDPDDWTYWWEHFSPAGFSFPCPRGADDPVEDCPHGCASDNEKISKVNRKIGFNVLASVNGQEYVNAFKVGPTVADKLKNRYARLDTLTDRDYTITRYKTGADRWDFDVEGHTPSPVDLARYELKNIEEMLQQSYEEAWGDGPQARANQMASEEVTVGPKGQQVTVHKAKATIAPQKAAPASEEPPFEEKTYAEEDLRAMGLEDLLVLVKANMGVQVPDGYSTSDEVVDWLLAQQ